MSFSFASIRRLFEHSIAQHQICSALWLTRVKSIFRKSVLIRVVSVFLCLLSLESLANDYELYRGSGLPLERGSCTLNTLNDWCKTYNTDPNYPDQPGYSCQTVVYESECIVPNSAYHTTRTLTCGNGSQSCGVPIPTSIGRLGIACPAGKSWNSTYTSCVDSYATNVDKTVAIERCPDEPCSKTRNPIDFAVGNKSFDDTDYHGVGAFPITFTRSYNSHATVRWSFRYMQRIERPAADKARVRRPGGGSIDFVLINGDWLSDVDVASRLEISSDGLTWIYTSPDSSREYFNTNDGLLTSIRNRYGLTQTLTYDADGRSFVVTSPEGDSLHVIVNSNGYPESITDSQSRTTSYTYSPAYYKAMTKVTYPDGKTKQYLLHPTWLSLVTAIIDENAHTSHSVTYDSTYGWPVSVVVKSFWPQLNGCSSTAVQLRSALTHHCEYAA